MCVGDFTGNGRPDVVTIEQDWDRARHPEPWNHSKGLLWENLATGSDGSIVFTEHVISDVNLGAGDEMVCTDVTGNGRLKSSASRGRPARTTPWVAITSFSSSRTSPPEASAKSGARRFGNRLALW
jgi:hypothetical protein